MPVDYVCVMNKNHKSSFGTPVTPPPQCCGKPMMLEGSSPQPTALAQPTAAACAQPAAAAQACPQAAPKAKPSLPQRPRKGARKG